MLIGLVATVGCRADDPILVSDSNAGAFEVSIATDSEQLYLAWYDTRDGNAEVYFRKLDAAGVLGGEVRLTETPAQSYEVSLAAIDDGVALAWYEKSIDGRLDAQLATWQGGVGAAWQRSLGHDSRATRNPAVALLGSQLFVAWLATDIGDATDVVGAWFSLEGTLLGEPIALGAAGPNTWNLNVAIDAEGAAWVAWDTQSGNLTEEVFIARVQAEKATLAQVTADDGYRSKYPDIAIDGQRMALTWFDERDGNREVYFSVTDVRELSHIGSSARRVTHSPGASIGAYLSFGHRGVGLVWSDDSGGANDIYFQQFDRDGAPLDDARALFRSDKESLIPAIASWRDGFAVAWNEVEKLKGGSHAAETQSDILLLTGVGARNSVDPDAAGVQR